MPGLLRSELSGECWFRNVAPSMFIDTTHTVKTGGDVDRIFLDLLPRLAPGVWVHIHDIFLPYEYPRARVIDERRAWGEQYLLQAFLLFNEEFRVEIPVYAVARAHAQRLAAVAPSFSPKTAPGAFWISRLDAVLLNNSDPTRGKDGLP